MFSLSIKQKQAFKYLSDTETTFIFYGGAAGGGKSILGCFWLMMNCLAYSNTRWFIGRDSLRDTRESVLISFRKVVQLNNLEKLNIFSYSDNSIKFNNGSEIIFLDLSFYPQKDPFFERLGSKEYTGGWIEEAGEVKFEAFDVLKSRIGRHMNAEYGIKSKILITANPKKGWLYDVFWKPYKNNELELSYKFIQSFHSDNEFLSAEYRQNLDSITDTVKRQRLIQGNFEYDDEDGALIPYNKIQDFFTNEFVKAEGMKFISSDIAISNDYFVIVVWHGFKIIDLYYQKNASPKDITQINGQTYETINWQPLIDKFKYFANKHQIPRSCIVYDGDGIGNNLKEHFAGAIPIHTGTPAINKKEYFNLKSQLYFTFADFVNNDKIHFAANIQSETKTRIVEEMQLIKRHEDVEKLRIVSKLEIKKTLKRSTDLTDAIAYRMLFFLLWNK